MQTYQITVPEWSLQVFGVIVLTILLALLTGFIVEWVKHRYTLKRGKKLAMFAVHNALVLTAAVFAGISYYLPFLQNNLVALQHLPYVGAYVVSIYAGANYLYALKGKAWFQDILKTAQKVDSQTVAQPTTEPVVLTGDSLS